VLVANIIEEADRWSPAGFSHLAALWGWGAGLNEAPFLSHKLQPCSVAFHFFFGSSSVTLFRRHFDWT
jgi:hypothetical protein